MAKTIAKSAQKTAAKTGPKPITVAILANAGGVGKSTIATHIAYGLALEHHSVTILDLDPQRSLDVFCGLDSAPYDESVVRAFAKDFKGDWNLVPAWNEFLVKVGQGHPAMAQMADDLVIRRRGEYVLADRLAQYPIDSEVILLDCPATLGKMCENAIAACTHVLIPIQLEMKSIAGVAELLTWFDGIVEDLQLSPVPQVLGLVPSLYDKKRAMHRQYLEELPTIAEQLGINVYTHVPDSTEFINASAFGIPLQQHRGKHPANRAFDEIVADLSTLIKGAK
ncbi:MAG: ParA family protein [Alkalinema sp. RU_4_3]|nr:ParA family protein [Alkalinema sp. RU_4_3]